MITVMIADDDQGILDSTRLLLEYEGYTVEVISDGEEVKKIGERALPQVLLLDIWLYGFNGGEIARYLKMNEKTKSLPIIMFSANRDIEKIARESGADDYLVKPFDLQELLEKIHKFTKHQQDNK